jgi:hypothetical protein
VLFESLGAWNHIYHSHVHTLQMERHYVDGHLVNVPPTLPLLGVSTMSYATMSANTVLLRVPLATVNGMFPHALGSRIHQSAELVCVCVCVCVCV